MEAPLLFFTNLLIDLAPLYRRETRGPAERKKFSHRPSVQETAWIIAWILRPRHSRLQATTPGGLTDVAN
jgi:hypothetical protein